tara:strand:- start:15 stop:197 length:183 start_codon:yes stop_codon:yes gene_type:complete
MLFNENILLISILKEKKYRANKEKTAYKGYFKYLNLVSLKIDLLDKNKLRDKYINNIDPM